MIESLHISNYALIDSIDIEFAPGFNIITGETGAGKSIIMGALSLLLGGRADSRAIRCTDRKSVIEAVFSVDAADGVAAILKQNDLDADGTEIILRRELSASGGRSRAFVNDTPVNLPLLKQVAERLVDIHSQHENQLLAQPDYQLGIIDSLAGNGALLAEYGAAYDAFRAALKKYTDTRDLIRRTRDDADFIQYQYEQLAAMSLQPGEHQALEQEREVLSNVGEIKDSLEKALSPLVNAPENVLSLLTAAVGAVRELAETFEGGDVDYSALADRLDSARIEISDVTDTISDVDSRTGADPHRLADVEHRLSELYSLELKHHVEDADGLIALRDRLARQIEALDDAENVLSALEHAARRAKKTAWELAQQLSERRSAAASDFAMRLRERAALLGMPNLRCEISITKDKLGSEGLDHVQFLFAFNKNQPLMPVGNTASGGELSRLMLTVKSIVAESMHLPSIIFDEVDTGVSGDIAGRMGAMMAEMGRYIQVITITHLPGVAACGRRHFKVYKEDDETSTNTRIRTLAEEERPGEIALMICGSSDDEAALANARALLSKCSK